jgi:transcriptional regulator with XRE-family HTH domain
MDLAELRHMFSSRIRKLREGKLNQGEFADSVGVSRGAMSYYEQELRTPDIGVLRAICEKYHVSADYLLGLMPDQNHAVSDVCLETGLSPETVKRLMIINLITKTVFGTHEQFRESFGKYYEIAETLKVFTSITGLLDALVCDTDGLNLLALLGAIVLDAEIVNESGAELSPMVKLKSASKNFHIAVPLQDLTSALWVNIQEHAGILKAKLKDTPPDLE